MKIVSVASALLVVGAAAASVVVWTKLPEIVANRATAAAGRTVKIGGLSLTPGRWIGVELRDASLANLPGGTRPDMATVARLTGEVALWPLLHGTVIARSVQVQQGDILLEKVGQQPNWRNGPKRADKPGGGRDTFPTLLGIVLDGMVTFRTTSGTPLVTKLDGVKLETAAADQPARLTGRGSYQGAPIDLDLKLGSYDQLHDLATPFPADIRLTSGDTVLHFVGTLTKPLDVDGADGRLTLVAPTPAVLEKVSGADPSPAPKLGIEGGFERDDGLWKLQHATGTLGDAAIEDGTLQLQEGATDPKTPDKVGVALRFAEVNLDRLLAETGGGGSSGESSFLPAPDPDPQIVAKLEAAGLIYDKQRFSHPKLAVSVEPGLLKLDEMSFGGLGGQLRLDGEVRSTEAGKAGALAMTLLGTGLEVSELSRALGAGHLPLAGRADVHAVADGTGSTAMAALKTGRASVVATMGAGSVSAKMVELASTDVTGLLRSTPTMIPLTCLLAVMEVRGGVASLGPMRLRSAEGTIVARGRADLLRETLDLVVASEAETTGALALDVPVRVTGSFDDPTIAPAGAAAGRAARDDRSVASLAPALRPYAQRSRCAG